MALVPAELYARARQLLPELLKFGIVGGLGTVVDLGGAALLHGSYHVEPLAAKAVSTGVATVITYAGSRFWTFRDRENQELKREAVLFIVLNLVGLFIAEVVVGLVTYAMSLHGQLEYNIASFLGTGFGTIFRYFAYKKWVFLSPGKDPAAPAAPAPRPFPDYPPWEVDRAFQAPGGQAPGGQAPGGHAPRAGRAPVTSPAFSSAWEREPAPAWDPALAPTMSWSAPPSRPAPAPRPSTVRAPDFPGRDLATRDFPADGFPTRDFPADGFPTRDFPATGFPAPAQPPHRPAPARSPAPAWPATPPRSPAPRSSGGGRHRKS